MASIRFSSTPFLAALLLFALSGCTTQTVKKVNAVKMNQAEEQLSQAQLLDVGIAVFDPGVPESLEAREDDNIFPQVRRAEARYVPYQLRKTLEASNQWGAVRVLPETDPAAEVSVTGRLIQSDGYEMAVEVVAVDATGRVWIDKRYEDSASQFAYRDDIDYPGDPFQDIYNQVANDLVRARNKLTKQQLADIRTIGQLRYAAELSPVAFGDHLSENKKGQVVINRLPSPNDPMLRRVNRIRESEYLFVDTVDQQYDAFYRQMDPSYEQWRRYSYEETLAADATKRSARMRMLAGALAAVGGGLVSSKADSSAGRIVGNAAVLGGLTLLKQGYDTGKQAKIHEDALKELATSFDAEVSPIVMNVEGEVIKLSGSLDAQYSEWRRLLREIYAEEVGLPLQQGNQAASN